MDLRRWAGSRVLYVLWLCNHYVMALMVCVGTLSMGTAGEFSTTLVNHPSCFYHSKCHKFKILPYYQVSKLNKYNYNTIKLKSELKDIHVHKDKNLGITCMAYQSKSLHIISHLVIIIMFI